MKPPELQSVFLTGNSIAERDSGSVFIMGNSDWSLTMAQRLAREGFQVLLSGNWKQDLLSKNIKPVPASGLEEIRGFPGAYEIVFAGENGRRIEKAGFVVAADAGEVVPKFASYGLTPSSQIISLSDLEKLIADGRLPDPRSGQWLHVAYLFGLKGEAGPDTFSRILTSIQSLGKLNSKIQSYVFAKDLKVAAFGLESLYRQSREAGTLFFKFDESRPLFETSDGGVLMAFEDPVIGTEMDLLPDLLVVDENALPPSRLKALWNAIPSSPVCKPYLQPESVRFNGVDTAKAGIFAIGPSRGVFAPEEIARDIDAAVLAVKNCAAAVSNQPSHPVPTVNPDKCVVCLTCMRLCPHGSISFTDVATADPSSCVGCGICAAECPMAAITMSSGSGDEDNLTERVKVTLRSAPAGGIAVFLCSHSGAHVMENCWNELRGRILPIPVSCAGSVSSESIYTAFLEGAQAVIVAGCFSGNCASVYGNSIAAERVNQIGRLLGQSGIDETRVIFVQLASNTPGPLLDAITKIDNRSPGRI